VRPAALLESRLGAEGPAQPIVGPGVVAFVREHGAGASHDGEGGQEQAVEQERVVDVGGRGGAGYRHAIAGHRGVVLGAPLTAVRGVGADNLAAAFGLYRAAAHDQGRGTTQQGGVDPLQQLDRRAVREPATQGRAAGLGRCRLQAAPWGALAPKPARRRQHPPCHCWRMPGPGLARSLAMLDHRRDQVQDLDV
jgi:hypothetical protein